MNQAKTLNTVVMMTTEEAQKAHEELAKVFFSSGRRMGMILRDIRDRKGWRRLNCNSFPEYVRKMKDEFGDPSTVSRWLKLLDTEDEIKIVIGKDVTLKIEHVPVLKRLGSAERMAKAYEEAGGAGATLPQVKRVVGRIIGDAEKATARKQKERAKDGWTTDDLDDDKELRDALDKVEHVYGKEDRKAIQNGAVGLTRKDIITLAKFDPPTMEKVQYLVMSKHWGVEHALKFANDMADERSTVEELINWCLTTKDLCWTGTFAGFEISVKATTAVKRNFG